MFKLNKSYVYDKADNGDLINKVNAYEIDLTEAKPLHLMLTLNQHESEKNYPYKEWSIFVTITQYPSAIGRHYGSITSEFKHRDGPAVFSKFCKIYKNIFEKKFQMVLNEHDVDGCVRIAIELQDMWFDFPDNS
jgi:hypothetical protein